MTSKRRHEGYLMIDNRNSPGVPEELMHALGLPVVAARGMFEAPTITCSHCQAVVVINPLRNRERAYCTKCDHYICDGCGARRAASGGECKTFKQIADEVQERAVLTEQRGGPGGVIVATG